MALTAIGKALAILDLLLVTPGGLRAAELGRQTGHPAGTVHRLLGELVEAGYVRRDPASNCYVIGDKITPASGSGGPAISIQRLALPHMRELAQVVRHACNLGVLRNGRIVFLDSIAADGAGMVMISPPGTSAPAHCTSMGKVLLSELPEPRLREHLEGEPLAACSIHTITEPAALREELKRVRSQEYAVDREELNPGVRCVAAPVRDRTGWAVAAISVSIPVHELPDERIESVASDVVTAARAVSHDLGFRVMHGAEANTGGTGT